MSVCTCEYKDYSSIPCAVPGCDNQVCELHGGEFDADYDEGGAYANASSCGECINRRDAA